jgi:hypothetical protein
MKRFFCTNRSWDLPHQGGNFIPIATQGKKEHNTAFNKHLSDKAFTFEVFVVQHWLLAL